MAALHRSLPPLLLLFAACGAEQLSGSDTPPRSRYPALRLRNPDRSPAVGVRVEPLSLPAEAHGPNLSVSRTTSAAEIAELAALGYATQTVAVEERAWYDPHSR